jgi:CheY-like chemotaxis protein
MFWLIPATPQVFSTSPTPRPLPEAAASERRVRAATAKPTVLVADDEELIADSLAEILNDNGYDATAVYGGPAAVETALRLCPDILLTDVLMPRLNGVEAARRIAAACERTRIVLFSGQAGTTDLLRTAGSGGFDFKLLPKPIHPDQLLKTLSGMLHS